MSSVHYNRLPPGASPNYRNQTVTLTQQQFDVLMSGQLSQTWKSPTPVAKTLGDFSATEMIMELIGRGYAVSKLPVDEHVEATNA